MADLHGNRIALEAVLTDGREMGVDQWWAIGDLVAIGSDPVGTLELLTNLPSVGITRGNTDRYVFAGDRPGPHPQAVANDPTLLPLFSQVEASFSWTQGYLAAAGWLPWLSALPLEERVDLPDGTRLLLVHASPGRDDGRGIAPQRSDEELGELLAGADADVVVAGHTHRPTDRELPSLGVRAVNTGSVSNPITDDLRASYAVVHADRDGYRIEHRRVAYDHDAVLAEIARSGHPAGDYIASFQRGEWEPPAGGH